MFVKELREKHLECGDIKLLFQRTETRILTDFLKIGKMRENPRIQ
jgi:hypothetical protein